MAGSALDLLASTGNGVAASNRVNARGDFTAAIASEKPVGLPRLVALHELDGDKPTVPFASAHEDSSFTGHCRNILQMQDKGNDHV